MHNNSIIMKGNFNRFHISGNYTFNRKSDIENNSNEVIPPPGKLKFELVGDCIIKIDLQHILIFKMN